MPEPGGPSGSSPKGLDDEDSALLEKVEAGFETVGELYNGCKFRAALRPPAPLFKKSDESVVEEYARLGKRQRNEYMQEQGTRSWLPAIFTAWIR